MACPAGGLHAWANAFELINEGPVRQRVRWYRTCSKCAGASAAPTAAPCQSGKLSAPERYAIESVGLQQHAARERALWINHRAKVEVGWTGGYDTIPRGVHAPWQAYWATYP